MLLFICIWCTVHTLICLLSQVESLFRYR